MHSVLLRALPYPEPDRLIALVEQANLAAVNLLEYAFWKEHSSAFSSAAAHGGGGERNLVVGARREWIRTRFVSADFFRTLGVAPSAGREFTPEETRRGGPPAVILSDEASRRVFSENESPLGRVVTLGDANFTVVGVLPRGFWFIEPADAFLPLRPSGGTSDGGANYQMIARLKPSNADRRRCSALEH